MGTKYVIRYGRNPKEEEMKYIILASLLLTGCGHSFYVQGHKVAKTNDCCKRLSLRTEQMSTFNRYCKVALFLSKSTNKAVGKVVQKNATAAVKVCKFVFKVLNLKMDSGERVYRVIPLRQPARNSDATGVFISLPIGWSCK